MSIRSIVGKRIAVHCDTEEKANAFLQKCEKLNIYWCSGKNATSQNKWQEYKEQTCYEITFGDIAYGCFEEFSQNDRGFKIIDFSKLEIPLKK